MSIDNLIYKTVGAAMEVYNHLGPGLLESIYEKAMIYELQSTGTAIGRKLAGSNGSDTGRNKI